MVGRREALWAGLIGAGGAVALATKDAFASPDVSGTRAWEPSYSGDAGAKPDPPGEPGRDYRPVVTPNGASLPFKVVDGVKVFHLIAEEVEHEFASGLKAKCWGYNGRVHGPTLEAVEGDRVRVYVTNRLSASTTVHWHGVYLPAGMDGVGGLTQKPILPGETFKYEWTFRQHGTLMYHSHHDEMTQMALGMIGMIVVHPRKPTADDKVDRDFVLMLSEWAMKPGAKRPDPNEMTDFNVLTINGKCFPATAPLVVKKGERVRIRIGNLSAMDHHSMHIHGHYFKVVATDGGKIPLSAQWPQTTVIVPTGSTRTIELVGDNPGDWPFHCHMTHHVMTQMGHGTPNLIGVNVDDVDAKLGKAVPGYMTMGQNGMGDMMHMAVPANSTPMAGGPGPFGNITMGGMFTLFKVRESLASYDKDPGDYVFPKGSVADVASAAELEKDGIVVKP